MKKLLFVAAFLAAVVVGGMTLASDVRLCGKGGTCTGTIDYGYDIGIVYTNEIYVDPGWSFTITNCQDQLNHFQQPNYNCNGRS